MSRQPPHHNAPRDGHRPSPPSTACLQCRAASHGYLLCSACYEAGRAGATVAAKTPAVGRELEPDRRRKAGARVGD